MLRLFLYFPGTWNGSIRRVINGSGKAIQGRTRVLPFITFTCQACASCVPCSWRRGLVITHGESAYILWWFHVAECLITRRWRYSREIFLSLHFHSLSFPPLFYHYLFTYLFVISFPFRHTSRLSQEHEGPSMNTSPRGLVRAHPTTAWGSF